MPKIESANISGDVILQPAVDVKIVPETGVETLSVVPMVSSLSYEDAVLADEPIGYWRLGDTGVIPSSDIIDEIAGNHASLGATPLFEQAGLLAGDADTAALFDSEEEDRLTLPIASNLFSFTDGVDDKPFSLEAWISVSDLTITAPIISKSFLTTSNSNEYILQVEPDGKLTIVVYDNMASSHHFFRTTASVISLDTPYHIVATYSGAINSGIIYVNGVSVPGTYTTSGGYSNMRVLAINVAFGNRFFNDMIPVKSYFNGILDEIAMYDKVLTSDRVLAHYNAGV